MKKFLSMAGVSLITSAFLDPLIQLGLDQPVPVGRDLLMACAGAVCLYLLVRYRDHF
jgi:hypothetical protein